jgi:hypothetical protein
MIQVNGLYEKRLGKDHIASGELGKRISPDKIFDPAPFIKSVKKQDHFFCFSFSG